MGWSRPNRHRRSEATAWATAMQAISYRGGLDTDGYPINGHGTAVRCFFAGRERRDSNFEVVERAAMDAEALRDVAAAAQDAALFDGGYQRTHYDGFDDPDVVFPHGYRWSQRGGNA